MSTEVNHTVTRDNNIAFIRAITMMLVVLGHSLSPFINNYYGEGAGNWCVAYIIKRMIYTFHMPLFMSVSGFLFYYEIERSLQISVRERLRNIIVFVDKKMWRLVVPFLLVMYLWRKPFFYLVGGQMPKSIKDMLVFHTTGPLWYLYVLFVIFVFEKISMWIIWTGKNHIKIALVCMFALAYLGYFMNGAVHHVMVYNFYFFIGIAINKYFDRIKKIGKQTLGFLLVLTLCLTVFLIGFNTEDINALTTLLNIVIALADIVIIYSLTVGLRDKPILKLISIADNHGMGVYLFHSEFIQVLVLMTTGFPRKLAWLCTFLGSFVLSFSMTILLKKIGMKMILGEFKSKQKYLHLFDRTMHQRL